MPQILETLMIIFFGISWPTNIIKSYRVRTAKGKSILFLVLILIGYFCGITAKIVSGSVNFVLVFYIINFVMISIDILLYFRNLALDKAEANMLSEKNKELKG
ncbi:MAG: hypothetical protein FWD36_10455 [Treponema sp.]|nr:hypothetical protein [Treponema sp.]